MVTGLFWPAHVHLSQAGGYGNLTGERWADIRTRYSRLHIQVSSAGKPIDFRHRRSSPYACASGTKCLTLQTHPFADVDRNEAGVTNVRNVSYTRLSRGGSVWLDSARSGRTRPAA